MIALSRSVRVWVHRDAVDMRKSFDTLAAVVQAGMGRDVLAGDVFVFVGRRPGQPLKAVSKAWQRIRRRASLPHLRLHDLRRSFGSWLGDAGFTSKQIGTVLGHKTDITSRVYMALGHESKRAAVEAVQTILTAARRADHPRTSLVLHRRAETP